MYHFDTRIGNKMGFHTFMCCNVEFFLMCVVSGHFGKCPTNINDNMIYGWLNYINNDRRVSKPITSADRLK
jgi:hypothetical protein